MAPETRGHTHYNEENGIQCERVMYSKLKRVSEREGDYEEREEEEEESWRESQKESERFVFEDVGDGWAAIKGGRLGKYCADEDNGRIVCNRHAPTGKAQHTHTHAPHTRVHARTHTHTHIHTHRMYVCTHTHTRTHTHVCMYVLPLFTIMDHFKANEYSMPGLACARSLLRRVTRISQVYL